MYDSMNKRIVIMHLHGYSIILCKGLAAYKQKIIASNLIERVRICNEDNYQNNYGFKGEYLFGI